MLLYSISCFGFIQSVVHDIVRSVVLDIRLVTCSFSISCTCDLFDQLFLTDSFSCVFYSISCTCYFFDQLCLIFDQLCVLFNQLYMLRFRSVVFDIRSVVFYSISCTCYFFDQLCVLINHLHIVRSGVQRWLTTSKCVCSMCLVT